MTGTRLFARAPKAYPRLSPDWSITRGPANQRLRPGKRQQFDHRHDQAEEVYVVLAGSGRMKLDEEIVEVSKLDAIRVSPETMRAFEAGEEGLEILVFSQHFAKDGEMVAGWWSD